MLALLQFIGAFVSAFYVVAGIVTDLTENLDSTNSRLLLAGVALFGGITALELACGIGLWKLKRYGRTISIVFCWIGLLSFPLGTVISIVFLVYLYKPGIRVLFSRTPLAQLTAEEATQLAAVTRSSSVALAVVVLVVTFFGIPLIALIAGIRPESLFWSI